MADKKNTAGFSDQERAAMQAHLKEQKPGKQTGEEMLLEKVAEMPQPDKGMAEKIHAIVSKEAPQLVPKTWYGMPAWATVEGKVVCFFKPASKFGARYANLGFAEAANLDEGAMWPTEYALLELGAAEEERIADLVRKAVS